MTRLLYRYVALTSMVFAILLLGHAHAETTTSHYALTDTVQLPGATRWDYLTFDSQGHHLFITRGESVDVFDVTTKKIIGTLIDTHGAHGVALAPDLGKGFISDGAVNTVTVFDLVTLKATATIPTGTKPDAIVYDTATQRIFAANGESGDMTVIDAKNETVLATLKLDGKPEFAVVDGKGQLYVNLEDKSQIAAIDTKALKITNRYNLAPNCDSPTGLAIDIKQERLFSVCDNKAMVIVDATKGKILGTLPIGGHSDAALFDPDTQLAFSSNGDGTLTVISASSPAHYKVAQIVPTAPTARTMAFDPSTHQIYLAAAETDGVEPATEKHPNPRPHIKPDTFKILIVEQRP